MAETQEGNAFPREAPAQDQGEELPATDTGAPTHSEEKDSESEARASSVEPKNRMCGVCEKELGKYKCSRCFMPYCSVACSRTHRESHPPDLPPSEKPAVQETRTESPRKSKSHPFSVLDNSPELQYLFRKYPNLPTRLGMIHAATLPPRTEEDRNQQKGAGGLPWNLQQAPGFRKKQNWTHDVGLRRGKEALRKARTDPGEDGEAVREYCELVLHLLAKAEEADVTAMVREQANEEDIKLIEKLMQSETV